MKLRTPFALGWIGVAAGFTALGCDFVFSYRSITAPLGTSGEVGIRVQKTHANCTLPNPYDYGLSTAGVQILGETPWKEVGPGVIEKWVLLSLAEVGDGYLKVFKTCTKEGYEEGVLPIKVTAPTSDGAWAQAKAGTYPVSPPEGYTVAALSGTGTVKDGVLSVGGKSIPLPTVPPTLAGGSVPLQVYYVIRDGRPFPLLLVGDGLFWRYDPLLAAQG